MEIVVYPTGFNVQPTKVDTPAGPVDAMQLLILDAGGTSVKFAFPLEAWEQFQRFIADPEGETARAQARAKIVGPDGFAASIGQRKH